VTGDKLLHGGDDSREIFAHEVAGTRELDELRARDAIRHPAHAGAGARGSAELHMTSVGTAIDGKRSVTSTLAFMRSSATAAAGLVICR